ncbi:hypothetical protein IMG5_166150, partial [Ichthyophthirius multifiliis]
IKKKEILNQKLKKMIFSVEKQNLIYQKTQKIAEDLQIQVINKINEFFNIKKKNFLYQSKYLKKSLKKHNQNKINKSDQHFFCENHQIYLIKGLKICLQKKNLKIQNNLQIEVKQKFQKKTFINIQKQNYQLCPKQIKFVIILKINTTR